MHAQQARRFLDRVVGFTVSPLLSRRLRAGLSAGRVQSAALRILVDRDEKIRVFVPREFFGVDVALPVADADSVGAQVVDAEGGVARFDAGADADALAAHLASADVTLDDVAAVDASQNPKQPFTTSTLQQAALSLLKLSVSDTMAVAQKLYEAGRITYMRLDAVFVAPEAQAAAREWLTAAFGPDAVPDEPPQYRSKEGAQEAHEALRPTDPAVGRESVDPDHAGLYDLIRLRLLASQMRPAKVRRTTWRLSAPAASGAPVRLVAKGRVVVDSGFHRVLPPASAADEPPAVPDLPPGTVWAAGAAVPQVSSSWTKPPSRYTEASLVAELESAGVGRPSKREHAEDPGGPVLRSARRARLRGDAARAAGVRAPDAPLPEGHRGRVHRGAREVARRGRGGPRGHAACCSTPSMASCGASWRAPSATRSSRRRSRRWSTSGARAARVRARCCSSAASWWWRAGRARTR